MILATFLADARGHAPARGKRRRVSREDDVMDRVVGDRYDGRPKNLQVDLKVRSVLRQHASIQHVVGRRGQARRFERVHELFEQTFPRFQEFEPQLRAALVQQLGQTSRAIASFASKGHDLFACISGTLRREDSRAVLDKLWNNSIAAWYEGGKDDPKLALLRLDAGQWQSLSSRVTTSSLSGVWARNPGEVYVTGSDGLIMRRSGTAAQGTWATVASGVTTSALNAVTGWSQSPTSGEAEVYAVGAGGTIVHKSGTSWSIDGGFLTTQELTGV